MAHEEYKQQLTVGLADRAAATRCAILPACQSSELNKPPRPSLEEA